MTTIKILTGSVRPGRFNIQPANWIFELAKKRKDIAVELVDLEKVNLPFMNEPMPPMMNQYSLEHTKKWSKTIAEADGFIFVTPEYNHSYSPVLKNAIDYLFYEWNYKPATYISYGSAAGGARAVEHLRGLAGEIKMYDLREQVVISNYWENMDENGQYKFTEQQEKLATDMLDTLIFWSAEMKKNRKLLTK
jgi:NAD(P)H-dependent FMN reductase